MIDRPLNCACDQLIVERLQHRVWNTHAKFSAARPDLHVKCIDDDKLTGSCDCSKVRIYFVAPDLWDQRRYRPPGKRQLLESRILDRPHAFLLEGGKLTFGRGHRKTSIPAKATLDNPTD